MNRLTVTTNEVALFKALKSNGLYFRKIFRHSGLETNASHLITKQKKVRLVAFEF